ncbi:hypothetical protein FQN55_002356 [Onygenales sp. PD_40]|nr:hypothetical protein FQN55_002356 [Onygenales sp. PD_40]KAK2782476.1 hypothetical protein FQN52_000909 [Onygenales sp. PD_12]KAK2783338.1 hypothetical protein FQN53_009229 [Emmonsiellopsis sp. PD_33]KAK2797033.1 hypothetical protein FQN51_008894 [Onygenales sp. PD_10]
MPPKFKRTATQKPTQPAKRTKIQGSSAASPESDGEDSSLLGQKKTDSNGDPYWNISRLRRLTVSSFKGRTLVSVREYYEKDGQELPGKKGISLSLDQFNSLVRLLPEVETTLKDKGEALERPKFSDANDARGVDKTNQDSFDEDEESSNRDSVKPTKPASDSSDEDEED